MDKDQLYEWRTEGTLTVNSENLTEVLAELVLLGYKHFSLVFRGNAWWTIGKIYPE